MYLEGRKKGRIHDRHADTRYLFVVLIFDKADLVYSVLNQALCRDISIPMTIDARPDGINQWRYIPEYHYVLRMYSRIL